MAGQFVSTRNRALPACRLRIRCDKPSIHAGQASPGTTR
jgi:hypothetical protein